jgi:hypothetical protein
MSCAELVAANAQSMTINELASSLAEDMLVRANTRLGERIKAGRLHCQATQPTINIAL